ncbi:tryptophanase leader peptide [Psychromonas algicola]|nr:tryptophanase leader peptide [Psychromonas sp. RZ5]TEW51230.1 tryptophanase leader peptide [Psychromonas sp. RZ5]
MNVSLLWRLTTELVLEAWYNIDYKISFLLSSE